MSEHTTAEFERLLAEMRPVLHRYCARMTGSVIDGEDVVQDALLKAFAARAAIAGVANPRAWLVRIAHNTALDFLRRNARDAILDAYDELDAVAAPVPPDLDVAGASLHHFMRLPTLQRAAVILTDVLDHSVEEVASITGVSPAAAKSALQRGREQLRAIAGESDHLPLPALTEEARARLAAYVDGFRTGDFDAVRAMLAEDVELDLVSRFRQRGKRQVGAYFTRYAEATKWLYAAGTVEGRSALLVYDREISLDTPAYFAALDFDGNRVVRIRDFLLARTRWMTRIFRSSADLLRIRGARSDRPRAPTDPTRALVRSASPSRRSATARLERRPGPPSVRSPRRRRRARRRGIRTPSSSRIRPRCHRRAYRAGCRGIR